jgi:hypothetical protein
MGCEQRKSSSYYWGMNRLALVVAVLLFLNACVFFNPNVEFNAKVAVPFQGIFGLTFTEDRSSVTLKPGDSRMVNISLRFKESSSGRIEPGSGISVYELSMGRWGQNWSDQMSVSIAQPTLTLNSSTTAQLKVREDAEPGDYTIRFEVRKIGGALGADAATSGLDVKIVR